MEECRQQVYYLIAAPWLLRSLVLVLGLTIIWTAGALVALMLAQWMMRELSVLRREVQGMAHQHQDFQALRQDLKELQDQARQWDRRAAALYSSLADLLDDRIAALGGPWAAESRNHQESQMDIQAIDSWTIPEVQT